MSGSLARYTVVSLAALTVPLFVVSMVLLGASSAWEDFGINGVLWQVPFVAMALLGALIGWRRPGHTIAWTLVGAGCLMVLNGAAQYHATWALDAPSGARSGAHLAAWLSVWSWAPGTGLVGITLILFPTGRPQSRLWGWVSRTALGAGVLTVPAALLIWDRPTILLHEAQGPSDVPGGMTLDLIANVLLGPGLLLLSVIAVVVRYRASRGDERQQLKWLVYAAGVIGLAMLVTFAVSFAEKTDDPIEHPLAALAILLAMTAIPVAAAVAILRYRLYDIDVVISRTVVFAGLAGFITAIYVGIVVGVGSLLGAGDEPNLALSIVATAVVAVAFQPVRERLTRLANRLVFGHRATPYEALSSFAGDLAHAAAPERTLERMAKLVADGTGADRVFVWLRVGETMRPTAVWPEMFLLEPIVERELGDPSVFADFDHIEEVTHDGELLGAITLSEPRGAALSHAEHELLSNLAGQVALLLRNLRLTEELRARIADLHASRRRLVQAQDDERRRLERDLHDGSQQQLAHLTRAARQANESAEHEGATQAASLLAQIADDGEEAIRTVQEIAHGIYPPLLAAEGLSAALGARTARAAVPVTIEADGLGRYDREIEAAVYFCVLEAVNNAAKYAEASQVTVRLSQTNDHLEFEVTDDGTGFDPDTTKRGHGLTNMTDRLDALEGHLHITGRPGAGTSVRGTVLAVSRHQEMHT